MITILNYLFFHCYYYLESADFCRLDKNIIGEEPLFTDHYNYRVFKIFIIILLLVF